MKKLLLIRHAKAAHQDGMKDFERPLTHSGIQDATTMAGRLHINGHIPQIIVTSPALRTKTTANIFTEHLSLPAAHTDKLIYEATEDNLLDIIAGLPDQYSFIALVGHNPGIAQILHYLTGRIKDVPTCTTAIIDFEAHEWKAISSNTGNLVYYDEPK